MSWLRSSPWYIPHVTLLVSIAEVHSALSATCHVVLLVLWKAVAVTPSSIHVHSIAVPFTEAGHVHTGLVFVVPYVVGRTVHDERLTPLVTLDILVRAA